MQIKKFEAPTIQEALETIKRELGPEAIILQTKKNKRGFGLMSKASVEITAAVSERALQKKNLAEKVLPDNKRDALRKMPATKQAEYYDNYLDKQLQRQANQTRDRVEVTQRRAPQAAAPARSTSNPAPAVASNVSQPHRASGTRYIDIEDDEPAANPRGLPATGQGAIQGGVPRYSNPAPGMSIEEEVRHLKRMLEEVKIQQEKDLTGTLGSGMQAMVGGSQGALSTPALQDAFEQLVLNGLDKRFAYNLIRQAGFELGNESAQSPDAVLDQLAAEIMKSTEVKSPLAHIYPKQSGESPVVIALVGPTGVGKTTTVAKLASDALLKRNLKVGLINLDSYKVAAFDQLGTYAKILNVPFRSVASVEDLKAAIQDFQNLDLVLVDTTGRSQRDPNSLKEMQALLGAVPNLTTQLVLSVTTRDAELYDMANRFQMFQPQGIIVSKLDEATIYGAIYNVSQKVKLPLLYFTTGQRVPEDIEDASPERVAALVLDI